MKKILALVLALAMVLGLAACGGNTAPAATEAPAAEAPATEAPAAEAADAAMTAADLKVGAIYINSKNDTAGYTFAHHNGITTAMNALGMEQPAGHRGRGSRG